MVFQSQSMRRIVFNKVLFSYFSFFFFKSGDFDGFGVIFLHRSRLVSFSFFISAG